MPREELIKPSGRIFIDAYEDIGEPSLRVKSSNFAVYAEFQTVPIPLMAGGGNPDARISRNVGTGGAFIGTAVPTIKHLLHTLIGLAQPGRAKIYIIGNIIIDDISI